MNSEQTVAQTMAESFEGLEALKASASPVKGLKAAHESAVLAAMPGWAPLAITGKDAADYLHRRLSQSVKSLPTGRGCQALQLSGEGRMECDLLLYRRSEQEFVAFVHASFAEAAAELIDKYVLMDEVEVRGLWAEQATLTLLGPRVAEAIGSGLGDEVRFACEADAWSMVSGECDRVPVEIYRDGRWATPCFQITVPKISLESVAAKLAGAVDAAGGAVISGEVQDYLRIENGVAQFGADTTVKTIPLEVNLRPAIDLNKGCFPGQEFLARINNLSHPANVLARLRFDASAGVAPGDAVGGESDSDGPEGRLTSVRRLEGVNEGLALATLPWKLRELQGAGIRSRDGEVSARVELLGEYPDASGKKKTP